MSVPPDRLPPPDPVEAPEPDPPAPSAGTEPPAGATWGPVRVLAGLGVLLTLTLFAAILASFFDSELESLGTKLYLQAVLAAALIGVAFLAAAERGAARPAALGLGRSRRPTVVPVLQAIGMYVLAALVLYQLLQPEQEDVARELGFGESTLGDLASFVLIVIAAPVAEEVFFRGFMFGGFRSRTGFAVAALASAAIWGLFHYTGPGSWPVVLQLAIFGIVLAWLYERTGSIRAAIFLHALNNLLAFIALASS